MFYLVHRDQLTVCRCRSIQSARINDDDTAERLVGLVPVTEDWHARLTLSYVGNHSTILVSVYK